MNRIIIILILICIIAAFLYYGSSFEMFDKNEKYTAIIVEPRKHAALELVLKNFTDVLDERWEFIIFHGTNNEEYVKEIMNKIADKKHVIKYVNLGVEDLTISDYNALFYNKNKIYDHIHTEIFLVFQTDTLISEKYKDILYEFIHYDYVGAPWSNRAVGNGGLSLRKKTKILEIIDNCKMYEDENEDIFFATPCKDVNIKKPKFSSARNFAIETVYNPNHKSFGIHKPWQYLEDDELDKISEYIPQLNELMEKQYSENMQPLSASNYSKIP